MPTRHFGNTRPGRDQIVAHQLHHPRGRERFQPLPEPTGQAPFRLSLADIAPAATMRAIERAGKIVFHSVGDTGGIAQPVPQEMVARKLEEAMQVSPGDRAAFMYHVGDVVYFNGEASEYFQQFYAPYEFYNAPIFAIPGNHDGSPFPETAPSLEAFMNNFCASEATITPDAGDVERDAMTQPNCYFTLQAPFVTIIGLYSNVPEGGKIKDDQIEWLVGELRAAPRSKALIVAVHHPVFSLDKFHGGSTHMFEVLEAAYATAERRPNLVLTGHVHNYQRFTHRVDEREIPYFVIGASGYHNLHAMHAGPDGGPLQVPFEVPADNLTLEDYVADRHGFLTLSVDSSEILAEYFTVPRPHESFSAPARKYDSVRLNWRQGRILPHGG